MIAEFYQKNGFEVKYFISGENKSFFAVHRFSNQQLDSRPFGLQHEDADKQTGKKLSHWAKLLSRHSGIHFNNRKTEIETIIEKEEPNIIFLDEFCVTDFILVYPYLNENRKCIVLSPFLPSSPHSAIPPLNTFLFPHDDAEKAWKSELKKQAKGTLKRKWKYLFRDHISILKKRFKEQKIPKAYAPAFFWEYIPVYNGVEKWYLQPPEIDFYVQKLPPKHRYLAPLIELNRKEEVGNRYQMFLKITGSNKNAKIIFCSLGSVVNQLVQDPNVLISFFNTITEVAKQNPNWFFALKVPQAIQSKVKLKSLNIRIFDFPPYLDLLRRSSLFITHCGGNSYLESIYMETPMLALPPSDMWDYNGNAARVVHHQLGLKSSLFASAQEYSALIEELLHNEKYSGAIKRMKKLFNENYGENYLEKMNLPL